MKPICIILFLTTLSLFFCKKKIDHKQLDAMLQSNDKNQMIEAVLYIADHKDTDMVKNMLKEAADPRITHLLQHKGMSIYQIKMGAMKQITSVAPPHPINDKPDSVNIKFYINLARASGWIK